MLSVPPRTGLHRWFDLAFVKWGFMSRSTRILPEGTSFGSIDGLCKKEQGASCSGHSPAVFENQLFSYKEAARYLRISEPYLRRLKRQGRIAFVPIGSRGVRFRLSSLDKWVEEREIK